MIGRVDSSVIETMTTKTMTTLIEDGSKVCLASGPPGMSGGVMTLVQESEIWPSVERYWLRGISEITVR